MRLFFLGKFKDPIYSYEEIYRHLATLACHNVFKEAGTVSSPLC